MKRITAFTCCLCVLFVAGSYIPVLAQFHKLHALNIRNGDELQQYFKYTGKNLPIVSGHRGGMAKGYPENSIAAFRNTLKYTPAFFEIDPRLTKDSIVVLMHDATIDRTTTGKGKVSDYTLSELKQFRLKDAQGKITKYQIPTLKEAIEWSKGKTVMNLDHKNVPVEMTARLLKEYKNPVVMLTVHNARQARFYLNDNPSRMLSAHILTKEAFDDYEKEGIPWKNIIAYIGPKHTAGNKELLDLLHAKGVLCMISAAPSFDKLKDAAARSANYLEVFNQGADILESDLPIEVARAIASRSSKRLFPKIGTDR